MSIFSLPHCSQIDKNKKVIYINARIIDPSSYQDIQNGQLITVGDKIADFGYNLFPENNFPADSEIIDCKGCVLTPGLIDIQVHLRDPGQTHKEDIKTGTMSAVAGGITTIVCQPNTKPVIDSPLIVDYITYKAAMEGYCNVKVYGSITKEMKGQELSDMAILKEHGVVGFTDDGLPVMNSLIMRRAFEYSSSLDLVIAQHAEDLNLSAGGCMNEGMTSLKLGVKGIPNISESIIVERDIAILELTGGRYHVLHVSTKESLESIRRAKIKGLNITCEVSPHHLTLTDEALDNYNTNAKMNPPLRSVQDRQALVQALKEGLIDAIATDHAPHDEKIKNVPLEDAAFGIVGLETMLPIALEFYHNGDLPLIDILAKMTYQPAKIINFDGGIIAKDRKADLTLIDINREWVIEPANFYSKSKNSPFGGRKVKGRAVMTVVGGNIVYRE